MTCHVMCSIIYLIIPTLSGERNERIVEHGEPKETRPLTRRGMHGYQTIVSYLPRRIARAT